MSKPELSPSDLFFHSFRHSQGAMWPQLCIFRYMDLEFDLQPDLHPTGQEFRRYARFLSGNNSRGHLADADNPEGAVYKTMKSLRRFNMDHSRELGNNKDRVLRHLTLALLAQETRILRQDNPWTGQKNGDSENRAERLQQRLQTGKGSFLYYYGRDGHETGLDAFDAMYADMWGYVLNGDDGNPQLAEDLEAHRYALWDAELSILGKTALTQVELSGV